MRKGIDVSGHQHPGESAIRWEAVRDAGYDWCGVKLTEGSHYRNRWAEKDVHGAQANGFEVVGYHFARPLNNSPSVEAANLVGMVGQLGGIRATALDVEDGRQLGWPALAAWVAEFLRITDSEFVYWNRDYRDHLNGRLSIPRDRQWLAHPGADHDAGTAAVIQYGQGSVPGILGTVDLNTVLYPHPSPPRPPSPHVGRPALVDPETAPALRFRNRGEAVRRLSRLLIDAGLLSTSSDVFGLPMRRAVTAFQKAHKLPATGRVDRATWVALDLSWRMK